MLIITNKSINSSLTRIGSVVFQGTPKIFYAGIKYLFIESKFGIEDDSKNDTNERNLNASIELHF